NDTAALVNYVEFARAGGTAQVATEPGSIGRHGKRTYTRYDLTNKSDELTLALAEAAINTETIRLRSVTLDTHADPRAFVAILHKDIDQTFGSVRIRATDGRPLDISSVLIDGMTHSLTPLNKESVRWTADYTLGRIGGLYLYDVE